MTKELNNNGMGLLSLLFAMAIIALIYYFATKANKKTGEAQDGYFKQTSLDASNYKGTLDRSKSMIDDAVKTKSQQSEGF